MKRSNRSPLWRRSAASEVQEELEMHLELRTKEYEAQGMSPKEARRKALERFGDVDRHAAECRREAGLRNRRWRLSGGLDELAQDLRFTLRQLRMRPAMATMVVGMLAVGIGLTATVAGMIHQALWQPLPYGEPDRLVTIWEEQVSRGKGINVVGPANFVAFQDAAKTIEQMAGFITVSANVTGDEGPPLRMTFRWVTVDYFDVLGVPPEAGRGFIPDDAQREERGAVVISHRLWMSRFGGRDDIVGQLVPIDGREREIVGVMPPEAALDMGPARAPYGDAADLWAPLPVSPEWASERGRWLMVLARLAPGATPEEADVEIAGIMERQVEAIPDFNTGWIARAVRLGDNLREPLRLPLGALAGAVLLVLLIVCINASSLLLSRNLGRRQELSVRRALGAGRGRINRQLLAEGFLIATLSAGLGWLLASRLRPLAANMLPDNLAGSAAQPPGWVPAATLGLALGVVLLCAWLPSLPALGRLTRLTHTRSLGGSQGQHRLRAAMVFAQTALALVLLVGSALMLQTVHRLLAVDPGFDTDGIVSFAVGLPRGTKVETVRTFHGMLIERVEALPGVETAGAIDHMPMAGAGPATSFRALDRPEPEVGDWPVADIRTVDGDAFGALGIDLIAGRAFDSSDVALAESTETETTSAANGSVIVSRMLADEYWPGGDAVGQDLLVNWGNSERPRRVVGVVAEAHLVAPGIQPRGTIYYPQAQESRQLMNVAVRTSRDLESLAPELRGVVAEVDPTLPLFDLVTIRSLLRGTLADQQFLSRVITAFAALAFLLSVLGIYGVTSLSVTESRQEVGLRMALGARPREVVGLFVRRVAVWTAAALVAGLATSVIAGRAVQGLFFGVEATEPSVLAGVALLVALSALVAAAIPARRAARVDPSSTLRWD